MSYYRTVLADFPISYYTLDEVKSGSIDYYNQIISSYPTYQAVRDAFASYEEISGQAVIDYSGNNNDGTVSGISGSKIMPLVSGGIYGTLISNETTITYNTPGLANKYYADNPFSIEVWAKLPNTSSSLVPIVADLNSQIGIYYQGGDVVFKVYSNVLRYKASNNKAIHIVASYNKNSLSLYFNGLRVATKQLNNIIFTNNTTSFITGPAPTNNYFVVDSVAFYRYNLSNLKIALHYQQGIKELDYSQIVYPDGGYLFSLNHSKIRPVARYYYPGTKTWDQVADENVIVPANSNYITFLETSGPGTKQFTFTETIIVPSSLDVTSSQISWEDDVDNIVVQVSLDGNSWQNCKNNSPIPYFNKNDGMTSGLIYLKVTMSSSDTSTDLPILRSLSLDFFSNLDFYADNSSDRIYSVKDYAISRYNHPIISYNDYNGLRMLDGGGINLDSANPYRTVEMIFTPVGGQNVLFSSNTKIFEWNSAGLINKSGISAIYINGVDHTSSTNISSFLTNGMPHHVVLVLSSQATTHYQLYTKQYVLSVSDTSFSIAESVLGNDSTAYLINNTEYQSSNI